LARDYETAKEGKDPVFDPRDIGKCATYGMKLEKKIKKEITIFSF
jgi:hypothetical protein